MIVSFFQKKISLIPLLLIAIALWYRPLFEHTQVISTTDSPLLSLLSLDSLSGIVYNRIVFLLLIGCCLLVVSLSSLGKMYGEKLYFAMYVFVITSSYEIPLIQSSWGFFACILLIISNFMIVQDEGTLTALQTFNAGLLFSFAMLLSPIIIVFIPLLFISVISQQFKTFKCYFTLLFGILVMPILFITLAFMLKREDVLFNLEALFNQGTRLNWSDLCAYIPTLLFLLCAVGVIFQTGKFMKKSLLKYYESVMFQNLYCLILPFLLPQSIAIALPLALLYAAILINKQFNNLHGKVFPWLALAYLLLVIAIPFWNTVQYKL